jgi:hypothetical protein
MSFEVLSVMVPSLLSMKRVVGVDNGYKETSQVWAGASAAIPAVDHIVRAMATAADGAAIFASGFAKLSAGYLSTPIPDGLCGKPTPDFTASGGVGDAKPGSIFWPRYR